jgi:hypothetical protein
MNAQLEGEKLRPKRAIVGDQAHEERERHVDGEDSDMPEPVINDDGSATIDVPDDPLGNVQELEDGSAIVDLDEDKTQVSSEEFDANMAEELDESDLATMATDLLDAIDRDKDARKKRDEQYAEGIRRTGLGNEAPGGASFDGASRAVHPVLVEGCIDFAARAMKELFPADGPVKVRLIGKQTKAKLQRAERKRQYMNWQATTRIKEYRRELEVLLTQLPLGGGQYLKIWYDPRWERIRTEFVPIDDLLLPFEATSLGTSSRVTHVQRITKLQFRERVDSGLYRDVSLMTDAVSSPDRTDSSEAAGVVEGVEDPSFNEDGLRVVYETQIIMEVKDDPLAKRELMPYILTVDEPTGKVLALRRNWDPEDADRAEPVPWIVEFPFIPWRGAYPIGLTHIIGGLSGAATGALRALLDSAHINNIPGGIKLGGARVTGQTVSLEPAQLTTIDAGPGVDDIRKLAMPLPINPPSTVLFQLLGWLTDQAKGVVSTAEERIADAGSNMPVGTALALIEQGSITFSAIHSRLHNAQKEALAIIHRLNAKHLSDHETVEELGELVVSRADFQGPMDVEPVSDPNIFSDAQRYAQLQAALQLAEQPLFQPLFKPAELAKRALALMKFPGYEEVLNVPGDPDELEPIAENVAATDPTKALRAFDDQDHLDHLRVHLAFMTSPVLGMNPLMSMPALPTLLNHCKEHIITLYGQHGRAAVAAAGMVGKAQGRPDGGEADAIAFADQELAKLLAPMMPMLQQVQQTVQQLSQSQQHQDPRIAAAQLKLQSDQQALQQKAQAEQAKLAAQQQSEAQDRQLEGAKLQQAVQADQQRQALDQAKLQQTAQSGAQANALEQARLQLEQRAGESDRLLEQTRLSIEAHFNQLNAQAEAQAAAINAQLTKWQTEIEMSTSSHNAHLAAQQEDSDRQLKLTLQQLQGVQEERLLALKGRIDAWLQAHEPKPKQTGE